MECFWPDHNFIPFPNFRTPNARLRAMGQAQHLLNPAAAGLDWARHKGRQPHCQPRACVSAFAGSNATSPLHTSMTATAKRAAAGLAATPVHSKLQGFTVHAQAGRKKPLTKTANPQIRTSSIPFEPHRLQTPGPHWTQAPQQSHTGASLLKLNAHTKGLGCTSSKPSCGATQAQSCLS